MAKVPRPTSRFRISGTCWVSLDSTTSAWSTPTSRLMVLKPRNNPWTRPYRNYRKRPGSTSKTSLFRLKWIGKREPSRAGRVQWSLARTQKPKAKAALTNGLLRGGDVLYAHDVRGLEALWSFG